MLDLITSAIPTFLDWSHRHFFSSCVCSSFLCQGRENHSHRNALHSRTWQLTRSLLQSPNRSNTQQNWNKLIQDYFYFPTWATVNSSLLLWIFRLQCGMRSLWAGEMYTRQKASVITPLYKHRQLSRCTSVSNQADTLPMARLCLTSPCL